MASSSQGIMQQQPGNVVSSAISELKFHLMLRIDALKKSRLKLNVVTIEVNAMERLRDTLIAITPIVEEAMQSAGLTDGLLEDSLPPALKRLLKEIQNVNEMLRRTPYESYSWSFSKRNDFVATLTRVDTYLQMFMSNLDPQSPSNKLWVPDADELDRLHSVEDDTNEERNPLLPPGGEDDINEELHNGDQQQLRPVPTDAGTPSAAMGIENQEPRPANISLQARKWRKRFLNAAKVAETLVAVFVLVMQHTRKKGSKSSWKITAVVFAFLPTTIRVLLVVSSEAWKQSGFRGCPKLEFILYPIQVSSQVVAIFQSENKWQLSLVPLIISILLPLLGKGLDDYVLGPKSPFLLAEIKSRSKLPFKLGSS